VRRRLRRWSRADEDSIKPLIHAFQQKRNLSPKLRISPEQRIVEPRYETNVYPLYYYSLQETGTHRQVYDYVFKNLPAENSPMELEELRAHVGHTVDSEIDILIEDTEYFIFIEAKEVAPNGKVKFEKKCGVHQLVNQYLQGKILEKLISKRFFLATVGANRGEIRDVPLSKPEQALMQLVDGQRSILSVVDLSWDCLAEISSELTAQ